MSRPAPTHQVSLMRLNALRAIYIAQTSIALLTRVAGYSWILEKLGSRSLLVAFVGFSMGLFLMTFPILAIVDRVGRAALMTTLYSVFALFLVVVLAFGRPDSDILPIVFLLVSETVVAIGGVHFFLLAGELLSPDQARHYFPSFSLAGAAVAALLGCVILQLDIVTVPSLLVGLIIPSLLCAGASFWIRKRYAYRVGPHRSSQRANVAFLEMREGLTMLRDSPLLQLLALLTALITSTGVMIDYVSSMAIEETFQEGGLLQFLGGLHVAINLLQLLLVLTVGPRLLTSVALTRTMASYPLVGALFALLGTSFCSPWLAICLRIFDRLENYLVLNPGTGILLSAFPGNRRGRAGFIYGGLVKPASFGLASALLLAYPDARDLHFFAILCSFVIIAGVLVRLSVVYRTTLIRSLFSGDARTVRNSIEALAEPNHRAIVPDLIQFLATHRDPIVQENLLLAAGKIGDPRFIPLILELLHERNQSVRCAAARALGRFSSIAAQKALLNMLQLEDSSRVKASILSALREGHDNEHLYPVLRLGLLDSDARVQANAAETIGMTRDPDFIRELKPLLRSSSPRIIANVLVALSRVAEEREEAVRTLERQFNTTDRSQWISGLYAAGEIRDPSLKALLHLSLGSPDADIHRGAAIAMGKSGEPDALDSLRRLLAAGGESARVVAQNFDRFSGAIQDQLLDDLSQSDARTRRLVADAFRDCGVNFPDELEQLEDGLYGIPLSVECNSGRPPISPAATA